MDEFLRRTSNQINENIEVVFEPKKQARSGRPDWRFHDKGSLGVYGYIEAKGLDFESEIDVSRYQEQVDKYLDLGHQVILSDGIDFLFFSPSQGEFKSMSLFDKPINTDDSSKNSYNLLFENEIKAFFHETKFRSCTERDLVVEIAKRAKNLSSSIYEVSELPLNSGLDEVENQMIEIFSELYEMLSEHHDDRLKTRKVFSDFVAQVLAFSLMYAHRIIRTDVDSPQERLIELEKFWFSEDFLNKTKNLLPFKKLSALLKNELESLGAIGVWYQDCRLLLANVKLTDEQHSSPDYHILFEKFLEVFDPEVRFDFGAFYTPEKLSGFAVKISELIAEKHISNINLFSNESKIIEPCCGTGTFIEKIIERSKEKEVSPNIIGLEILPAPYSLAHHRVVCISEKYGHEFENVRIFLTNTLMDEIKELDDLGENWLREEKHNVDQAVQPPVTFIVGNPPSSSNSDYGSTREDVVNKLLDDFRPPEGERTTRQNIQKQITNPFVKFVRWSIKKALDSDNSFVSLIVPDSFLESGSYKYARKYLSENFLFAYILDIDKDLRVGTASANVFNVMQGRSLICLGSSKELLPGNTFKCFYKDIRSFSKDEKLNYFDSEINLDDFNEVELDPSFTFRERGRSSGDISYESFWPIHQTDTSGRNYIFERYCSGVKLAPTHLFVHLDEPIVIRRSKAIARDHSKLEVSLETWFSGNSKAPKPNKFNTSILNELNSVSSVDVYTYSYRPFTETKVLLKESIFKEMAALGGGGTRYRPEVLSAFGRDGTIGLAFAPATKDISDSLHNFCSFTWGVADNDLCKRGNSKIYTSYFPEYKKISKKDEEDWDPTPKENISPALIELLVLNYSSKVSMEDIIFYVYAVVSSKKYLDTFSNELFNVADKNKCPRIPLVKEYEVFLELVELGKKLALCESDSKFNEEGLASEVCTNKIKQIEEFAPFKLKKVKYDSDNNLLRFYEGTAEKLSIAINDDSFLMFQCSGYNVFQQWIKLRCFSYYRKKFSKSELETLYMLEDRINTFLNTIKDIDIKIQSILDGDINII